MAACQRKDELLYPTLQIKHQKIYQASMKAHLIRSIRLISRPRRLTIPDFDHSTCVRTVRKDRRDYICHLFDESYTPQYITLTIAHQCAQSASEREETHNVSSCFTKFHSDDRICKCIVSSSQKHSRVQPNRWAMPRRHQQMKTGRHTY